jgi:diacylglycerol kinase (ATP)
MKKIWFIINPVSGTVKKDKLQEQILKYLDTFIFEPGFYMTSAKGDATRFVESRIKKGDKYFVAVGGDGTVNEIAKVLVKTDCFMGIIATGSGNGLARHLKLPVNVSGAVKIINKGNFIRMDYGLLNKKPFFCTCGVGFDAHVGHLFAESHTRGFFSYIKATLKEFYRYKPKKYKLIHKKGKPLKRRAFLVTFANASQYGNNAYIAPDADVSDGLLDVCVMRPFPFLRAIPLSLRLFNKSIHRSDLLETFRTKKITLIRKKKGEVHFDGEPYMMGKKLRVKIVPAALNVFVRE